jgi:hypothetical protein
MKEYRLEPITDPAVQAALDWVMKQFKDGQTFARMRVPKVLRDHMRQLPKRSVKKDKRQRARQKGPE